MSQIDTREIHKELEEHLPLDEGQLLTGWIVVYEGVTAEGGGVIGYVSNSGMSRWNRAGMLDYAKGMILEGDENNG